jgi:hypothetical protein
MLDVFTFARWNFREGVLPLRQTDIAAAIGAFRNATQGLAIEQTADQLANISDIRSVDALLYRLADSKVQDDSDVEDAVCSALVRLGVMDKLGNLNFRIRSREKLSTQVSDLVFGQYFGTIPLKYFALEGDHKQYDD